MLRDAGVVYVDDRIKCYQCHIWAGVSFAEIAGGSLALEWDAAWWNLVIWTLFNLFFIPQVLP